MMLYEYLNRWTIFEASGTEEVDSRLTAALHRDTSEGYSVERPIDVCTALLQHGVINDPYYSINSTKLRWIEHRYWIYVTEFDKPAGGEKHELCFYGLDTLCDIYLNGSLLGHAENMFRTYRFDVGSCLEKKNILALVFYPHERACRDYDYSRMSVFSFDRLRAFVRKSAFSFGWDWAPRMITAGLWKPVLLTSFSANRIREVYTWTESVSKDRAVQGFRIALEQELKDRLTVRFFHGDNPWGGEISGDRLQGQGYSGLQSSGHEYRFFLDIADPALWWPWDMGEPELNRVEIALFEDDKEADAKQLRVGLRIVELDTSPDSKGSRFHFKINHAPLYCRGANWVPADCLLSDIPADRYRRLLKSARSANMNMLRVWGGGIYEADSFYDCADELGILIWQDFAFSSSHYPDYCQEFVENVGKEAQDNIIRLRNHPSLVFWCGNNECQWLHSLKLSEISDEYFYGKKIFHELLPKLVGNLDPRRPYWPGSPWGGENPNSEHHGDRHSWQVYGGVRNEDFYGAPYIVDRAPEALDFKHYAQEQGHFISEFGLAAFPVADTLARNIPENQMRLGSFELAYRNQDICARGLENTVARYCGKADNLRRLIQFSMLCQAEALRFAVEHFRRNRQATSGALLWQLNDCWPGITLSLLDYYLVPKASYYYAKKFFNPVLYSAKILKKGFELWVCNDLDREIRDTLSVRIGTFLGEEIFLNNISVSAEPGSSQCLGCFADQREHHLSRSRWTYLSLRSKSGFGDGEYFFLDHKDLGFPEANIKRSVVRQGSELILSLSSDCFTRFVQLQSSQQGFFCSENYFNLLPGEQRAVILSCDGPAEIDLQAITIDALNLAKSESLMKEG